MRKEAGKFEKLFSKSLRNREHLGERTPLENCLTIELKKQNQHLKLELEISNQTISTLKRKTKYTKILELES